MYLTSIRASIVRSYTLIIISLISCNKQEDFNISGIVYQDGVPVDGCTVLLENWYIASLSTCDVIDSTITSHGGRYSFIKIDRNVKRDEFNLVVFAPPLHTVGSNTISYKDATSGNADNFDLTLPSSVNLKVTLDSATDFTNVNQIELNNRYVTTNWRCDYSRLLDGPIFPRETNPVLINPDSNQFLYLKAFPVSNAQYFVRYDNGFLFSVDYQIEIPPNPNDTVNLVIKF